MSRSVGSLASFCAIGWLAWTGSSAALARGHGNSRRPVETGDQAQDSVGAQQAGQLPVCFDNQHEVLEINNIQVQYWKTTTRNQFRDRAHVRGPVVRIYEDRNGHDHLSIQIGTTADVTVELVYNQEFGGLPEVTLGTEIESCGDYITSTAPYGAYPASPDGAIVHWIHRSNSDRHESGYIAVAGVLYGY